MFAQEVFFETAPVHRLHHLLDQVAKTSDEPLDSMVIWMFQQFVIQIPNKMNQAFLLRTLYSVVRRVEI